MTDLKSTIAVIEEEELIAESSELAEEGFFSKQMLFEFAWRVLTVSFEVQEFLELFVSEDKLNE